MENRWLPSTLTVNTLNDTHAATPGTSPLDSNGDLSLRSAIEYLDATQLSGSNSINFSVSGSINLNSGYGALNVTDTAGSVTISGAGQTITIDGQNATEDFSLASGTTVTLNQLTITGASASYGGGINNQGTLTITGSTLSGNTATYGGGILNDSSGMLMVSSSTLSGNQAGYAGGGLYNRGAASISGGTIVSGNQASGGPETAGGGVWNGGSLYFSGSVLSGNSGVSYGGGLFNYGTATLTGSTVSGNSAQDGGGIGNYGTLTLTNSTLFGNSVSGQGGGLSTSGTATLANSTLSGNTATTGGGIYTTGTTSLTNALAASNTGTDPDIVGSVSGDHNLIGDGTGMSGISNGSNGNQVGNAESPINPLLSMAAPWGGSTPVLVPLPGSPAIGGGGTTLLTTDQRGRPRVVAGRLDIGAVETGGYTLTPVRGDNQAATVSTPFAQPLVVQITANNGVDPVAGGMITFLVPSSGASASLSPNPAVITARGLPTTNPTPSIPPTSGQAGTNATANSVGGSYVILATTGGASSSAVFQLTNSTSNSPTPPTPSPTPAPLSPWFVLLFFVAEDQFAFSMDSVLALVSTDPMLTQAADVVMQLVNDYFGQYNSALFTGLAGLHSAIDTGPYSGTFWANLAQAVGLDMATSVLKGHG